MPTSKPPSTQEQILYSAPLYQLRHPKEPQHPRTQILHSSIEHKTNTGNSLYNSSQSSCQTQLDMYQILAKFPMQRFTSLEVPRLSLTLTQTLSLAWSSFNPMKSSSMPSKQHLMTQMLKQQQERNLTNYVNVRETAPPTPPSLSLSAPNSLITKKTKLLTSTLASIKTLLLYYSTNLMFLIPCPLLHKYTFSLTTTTDIRKANTIYHLNITTPPALEPQLLPAPRLPPVPMQDQWIFQQSRSRENKDLSPRPTKTTTMQMAFACTIV